MRRQGTQYISLKSKLIMMFMLLLCLPFLVFGFLWYKSSTETIEANAVENSRLLMSQIDHSLETYFSDLRRATLPLLTHPLIQEFINIESNESYEIFRYNQLFTSELFPYFIYGRADIARIRVLSSHGNVISSYSSFLLEDDHDMLQRYDDEVEEIPLFNHYRNLGISGTDPYPLLTITRKIVDKNSYIKKGIMAIDLKLNVILNILSQVKLGESGYVWLVNEKGQIIYHPDMERIGQYTDGIHSLYDNDLKFSVVKDDLDNKLSIYQRMESMEWMMISELPLSELNEDLVLLRNRTLWFSFSFIIIALIAAGGFSLNLTKSLSKLQGFMKRAEIGDMSVAAPESRRDEIGSLYRSFNKMVSEIKMLLEEVHSAQLREKELEIKKRESVLHAMQAQINPHFLYNTLEVINSHAIVEDNMVVSRMATGLADLFRYSVGNPEEVVNLVEELLHSKIYLDIQKERYRHLKIEMELNEQHIQCVKTVKLMLQPIVENVFKHGYEGHKKRPDYIKITGGQNAGHFILRVIDYGGGMSQQQLEHYNKAFLRETIDESSLGLDFNREKTRIGMWNVHCRLRISFGHPYGLYIDSSDENGTVIAIKLPVE